MLQALIPVKALSNAKGRLAPVLSHAERRALVVAMLNDVLDALHAATTALGITIISNDHDILAHAQHIGSTALFDHIGELNGALTHAATQAAHKGATAILVLPADVPLVTPAEIDILATTGGTNTALVIAPARDGGTNGLYLNPPTGIPFQFGPNSRTRHLEAATARGIETHERHLPGLALDIDHADDLVRLAEAPGATAAQHILREIVQRRGISSLLTPESRSV